MMKRIVALALCLACLLVCFAGCSHGENDKGAHIRMYLSEPVYDVDPLNAFDSQATLQIVSLIYEGLFTLDNDGDVQNALVDDYEYVVDEEEGTYKLVLTLKETKWSDGVMLTASDAQYAFLRLFSSTVSSSAVAMLFDIKNAKNIAVGIDSVDHLGVAVIDPKTLEIEFERDIEIEDFLPILASPALYPLRADKADTNVNWSKLSDEIVCSGPFRINTMDYAHTDGFILERNGYYYRDRNKDDIDKYVNPYRIIIDYKTSPKTQLDNFNSKEAGAVHYFGYIPLVARTDSAYADVLKKVDVTDAPSTHVYYMNLNVAPFDNATVRSALSMALDREAMAAAMVYAEAADGLVPHTVFNRADKTAEFRDKAASYLSTTAKFEEAKQMLAAAKIDASQFSFTLTVNAENEEHVAMGEMAVKVWKSLGFDVELNKLGITEIITFDEDGEEVKTGAYDSDYRKALQSGSFDMIALDLVATASTAFSYLAPFAAAYSGNGYSAIVDPRTGKTTYVLNPHVTGYNSATYNSKIEAAYAEKNEKKRAELLHQAEELLLEEAPVIPVVYNQNVSLTGKKVSGVKSNFFCPNVLTDAKLSGYWKIALTEGFVEED